MGGEPRGPSHASKPHNPTPCVGCSMQHGSTTLGMLMVLDHGMTSERTYAENRRCAGHHAPDGDLTLEEGGHVDRQTPGDLSWIPGAQLVPAVNGALSSR